ncbi:MAG: zinc ABC transporter substrate-binding protein [Rhodospirillales bacterium]|nr:zinc ABC transporter substrate-binding protein [Alphaproteobacteria bacterium]MCB9986837.1 zinc ABC transporter substrate-binding protein [Rhodospirillales bacterium]USO08400.1 MAG: zinc ABC transporter substrate-binding protein [Rhodospirillales bacterium]
MLLRPFATFALFCFALCVAVFAPGSARAAGPVRVVASFSILADMLKNIGGNDVSVTNLIGPDADPHAFDPTPDDMRTIAAARLVFINGLGLEGWLTRLKSQGETHNHIVTASAGIAPRLMKDGKKTAIDPHAWQDMTNAHVYVRNIADALAAALPDEADAIRKRAEDYDKKIDDTDKWIRSQIDDIPPARRLVITSHDAFGYFSRAYGVQMLAPQGLSTETEPSAADLAKLDRQVRDNHVTTVFLENMSDPRLIERIARDTDAQVGKPLYADALSPPDGPAPDYLRMMRYNVTKMVATMREADEKQQADAAARANNTSIAPEIADE